MAITYDILIVGGGMVGASLAIALSGQGLRIGLVEAHPLGDPGQPSYDDRAIALSYGSQRILHAIGLWSALAELVAPIQTIHISDRGHFGSTRLRAAQERVSALGYVIPAKSLGHLLWARLTACTDVTLLTPAQVVALNPQPDQATLQIQQGEQLQAIQARLVVAADGGNSTIRQLLSIETMGWDYPQTAIVANITPERPHANTAYQRFTATGPVALLPLLAGHCTLIWTVATAQQAEVMDYEDAHFLQAFQARFGHRLGVFRQVGRRHHYPLKLQQATQVTHTRTVILGNAAHTLHPIAGQGFNLGLRDVAALVEVVLTAQHADADIGSAAVLQDYQVWRGSDQQRTAQATDGLVRLFSNPLRSIQWVRNTGLCVFNHIPGAKHALAQAAMGLSGRLPSLARGVRPTRVQQYSRHLHPSAEVGHA